MGTEEKRDAGRTGVVFAVWYHHGTGWVYPRPGMGDAAQDSGGRAKAICLPSGDHMGVHS